MKWIDSIGSESGSGVEHGSLLRLSLLRFNLIHCRMRALRPPVWIDVEKSASHHVSQGEIGSDNPCYQHLSRNTLLTR
jgi:hypothetical protein